MSQFTVSNFQTVWRSALLASAMAAIVPVNAAAAVPPAASQDNPAAWNKSKATQLVADADKAIRSGNYRLALIVLKNAISADPGNASIRARLGMVLLQLGDEPAAERELRQARKDGAPEALVLPPLFNVMLVRNENQLLLDQFPDPGTGSKRPSAPDILKGRALAFQGLNKAPEAIDAMDRSLALRRDASGLITRARLSLTQGNPAEARKFVDEAVAKSDKPDALLFKAGILLSANDYAGALNVANQVLAKFPDNLQGRFARIEANLGLKQDAAAKSEVDDIVAKYPNAYLGIYYRALLLARAGHAKEAWNFAQNLPGDFRDTQPRIALMIAQMAVDAGNEDTGASILGRILAKNPTLVTARVRLAAIRLKQNNPADAADVLDPIKNSSDVRVLELLSNSYLRLNRNDDALAVLRKMDADGKGKAEVKRSIALLEIRMGHTEQGMKDLAQAVSREPSNPSLVVPFVNVLTQARRFPEALAAADRLGSDPKQRTTALVLRGEILALQHDNAGAQAAFDKAVQADPRSIAALYSRAEFLLAIQKPADANRDLRAILALDSKNVAARLKLAEIAALQGQDQNVRSLLGEAINVAPQSTAPRLVLVRYLIARNDLKAALVAVNDLVRVQPKNTEGLAFLGQIQSGLGQKKEAVATYRRLVSLMPTAAGPQVLLGGALSSAGDRDGAARAMETAVKLSPSAPEVRAAQINLQFSQGNTDAAVATARAFQASNPKTEADILLADTLVKAKRPEQAVAVLNKSLADRPSNVIVMRLARDAVRANDKKRATDLMSSWLSGHPDDAIVRMEYANLLMQQEDSVQAIAQYQMMLKQEPNNVVVLNNLGWLLQDSDPKRALSMLTLAAKLAPASADVADTLGWLKLRQKDAAGGLALLTRAHDMKPQDAAITYHLVVALDANGKRDAARGMLKTLLASNATFKDRPAAVQLAATWR